jgi:hypothetical protein
MRIWVSSTSGKEKRGKRPKKVGSDEAKTKEMLVALVVKARI